MNLGPSLFRSLFAGARRFARALLDAAARFVNGLASGLERGASPATQAKEESSADEMPPRPRPPSIRKRVAEKQGGSDKDRRTADRDIRFGRDDGPSYTQPYVPQPLDDQPPCVARPQTWRDEPYYCITPYAVAGSTTLPAQYGAIGTCTEANQLIAADFNTCFAHAFFGTPKSGKTYIEGIYIENGLIKNHYQNVLESPLCAIAFGFGRHGGGSHIAEHLASRYPNRNPQEVYDLMYNHGTLPEGIKDVVGLTLSGGVLTLREQNPHSQVLELKFTCKQLGIDNLKKLMVMDSKADSLLAEEISDMVDSLPRGFTKKDLIRGAKRYKFRNAYLRKMVLKRLKMACKLIDDSADIRGLIKAGRLIVVEIRDAWLPWTKAMKIFQVLLDVLVMSPEELPCNLLLCIGEAHKFLEDAGVRLQIEHIIKERRHLRTSVVLSSQDPTTIPRSTLSEMDGVGLFRTDSERWIKHLAQDFVAFRQVTAKDTAALKNGQMIFWAQSWCVPSAPGSLDGWVVQVQVRPRMSHHGGATLTAVPG